MHSSHKLCSKFAPRNPEHSSITESDNSINNLTPNNSNSNIQIKQSTPSKVRFADEAGPSVSATPVTPNTDTKTVTSPSVDDLYLDTFNFAISKIFSRTLMASLITKDAILKEIRDCILTENEDRCKQISPYIHSFWKDLHVKNGCVCVDDRIDLPQSKMPTSKPYKLLTLEHGG